MKDIEFCTGGGCTAKLGPSVLACVLEKIEKKENKDLLVGFEHGDDAAVYRLTDDLAVVQTLDFFPPMVDDPYVFGQIAAANALSDVYAMGGEVKTALNIVCFPEQMNLNVLGKILTGGNEKVEEAGGTLAGGHSIADAEVKYGLSVMGTVHPDKILANTGCRPGDVLILTKPLGVGLVCTANRMGKASKEAYDHAVRSMTTLNKYAAEAMRDYEVHGCTDVTGFGFLGHLCEMLGEDYSADIDLQEVPCIPEACSYATEYFLTAAGQRNRNHVEAWVSFSEVSFPMEEVLFDPQTSGGLLFAVSAKDAGSALETIRALGLPCGAVGTVTKRREKKVYVDGRTGKDESGRRDT